MLDSTTDWVWDFWTAHDGRTHHMFFLTAPRSLGDPELRHRHARVGHAVSDDLRTWAGRPDALRPQPAPAYDAVATWTGCVVADPAGGWRMFTSGISGPDGLLQRIGVSDATDLDDTWRRSEWVLSAEPRWYLLEDHLGKTSWRDPFVIADESGLWHMYITAKAAWSGWPSVRGNGAVAHAVSRDLHQWEVLPPIGAATGRFDQLEVVSLARVDDRWVAVFSCLGPEIEGARPGDGGVWTVPVEAPGAPIDLDAAVRLTDERLYVGRVVDGPDGPSLLAFRNQGANGGFVGGVIDPQPVGWRPDGTGLVLLEDPVVG